MTTKREHLKEQVCQIYPAPRARCIRAKDTRSAYVFLQVSRITVPTSFMTLNMSLSDQGSDKVPYQWDISIDYHTRNASVKCLKTVKVTNGRHVT